MSIGLGNATHAGVGPSNPALRSADGPGGRRGPEPEPQRPDFQAALRSVEERSQPMASVPGDPLGPDSATAQPQAGHDVDLGVWIGTLAVAPGTALASAPPMDRGTAAAQSTLPGALGKAVQQVPTQAAPVGVAGPAAPGNSIPAGWPAPTGPALGSGPGADPAEFASAQAARMGSATPPGWRAHWPQAGAVVAPGPTARGDTAELPGVAATASQGPWLPVDAEDVDPWGRVGGGFAPQPARALSDAGDDPVPPATGFRSWGRDAGLLAGSTVALQPGVRGTVGRSATGAIRADAQSPGLAAGSATQLPFSGPGSARGHMQGAGRVNAGSPGEGLTIGLAPAIPVAGPEPFASSPSLEGGPTQADSANPAATVWQGDAASVHTRQGSTGSAGFEHAPVAATKSLAEQVSFHVFQGAHRAEITLQGVGASAVELRIELRGNLTSVEFRTDNPEARALLENTAQDLKDMLQRQGLVLSGVSVGNSGEGAHGTGQPRDFQRPAAPMEPVTGPVSALSALAQRVNGLVDLYV